MSNSDYHGDYKTMLQNLNRAAGLDPDSANGQHQEVFMARAKTKKSLVSKLGWPVQFSILTTDSKPKFIEGKWVPTGPWNSKVCPRVDCISVHTLTTYSLQIWPANLDVQSHRSSFWTNTIDVRSSRQYDETKYDGQNGERERPFSFSRSPPRP